MMHPARWRETADPFALPMQRFQLTAVLGYPHAGNDVFHVRGMHEGKPVTAYIKAARHQEANLRRELQLLQQLKLPNLPRLLDWDADGAWLVTEALPGQRLSMLVDDQALEYMAAYGEQLARLHRLQGDFSAAPHRRFMDVPDEERCHRLGLEQCRAWLLQNPPGEGETCFCHGDFHYANLLWQAGRVSGILDLELAGLGDREFDAAWAVIRRPGQRFMKSQAELERFLEGYQRAGSLDWQRMRYYMVNAYAWFCGIGAEDAEYTEWVHGEIRRLMET